METTQIIPERKYIPITNFRARTKTRAISTPHLYPAVKTDLPKKASLRSKVIEIYDQGGLNSSSVCAFCAAYRLLHAEKKEDDPEKEFVPSRLWIYFYGRLQEGPYHRVAKLVDSGVSVIDCIKYIHLHGACSEMLWNYDESKYNIRPPKNCRDDAPQHKISTFGLVTADQIKYYIANKHPVLAALEIYESFNNPANGNISLPSAGEQLLGGHEVMIIGYNDETQMYEIQNSWGDSWGDCGFGYLPYAYIQNQELCPELVVIKL